MGDPWISPCCYVAFGSPALSTGAHGWVSVITVVAYLTMIGGNLLAVAQRSVKRMLAYSSIAHAGYLLVGFVAGAHAAVRSDATRATLFYLAGYTATALERRDTLAPRNRGADTPLMESGVSAGPGSPGEKREATKVDLDDLPANVLGEIIEGTLYVHPRPRPRHSRVIAAITGSISPPFDIGLGGPGGWWILPEPGIELPDAPEIVPDVAGWRRERLVELPEDALRIVPDWVCEILSPGTRRYDMRVKRPYYAQIGVQHMWVVDYEEQTLQISRLHEGQWLEIGAYAADERVRAEPFEAIELALGGWWGSSK